MWRQLGLYSGLALLAVGVTLVTRARASAAVTNSVVTAPVLPPPPTAATARTRRAPVFPIVARLLLVATILALAAPVAPVLIGWQVYAVEGASMEPTIPLGSLITVRPTTAAELAVGEVITFVDSAHRQARITHRVSAIDTRDGRPSIRTRGDANTVEDVWDVSADQPIARVVYFIPLAGYFVALLSTMQAKLLLVGVIAALLVAQSWPNSRRSVQS